MTQPATTLTDGSPVSDDHRETIETGPRAGQQKAYVVLSDAERAKGFVRPVRRSYIHVGARPVHPTRPLTDDEKTRYAAQGYAVFEVYPEDDTVVGRFWTAAQLKSGCQSVTTMGDSIAETYARDPAFYGATFCCACGGHFPVGEAGEFVWAGTTERVGT